MRILLDHNVSKGVRRLLRAHVVLTTYPQGWAALSNGRLLTAAESAGFALLITRDQDFLSQHRLEGRQIGVALLIVPDQTFETWPGFADELIRPFDEIGPGRLVVIELDS